MPVKTDVLSTVLETVQAFAPSGVQIAADTPLLDDGVIDSASMVNILLELEGRLGVRLGPGDLTFDHFQTCETLAALLGGRLP